MSRRLEEGARDASGSPPPVRRWLSVWCSSNRLEHPLSEGQTLIPSLFLRQTALGALAVCQTFREKYALPAEIKWPNDVLVNRSKLAGILVEAHWQGDQLQAVILGIGINIAPESVPVESELIYPATCVQTVLGRPVDRLEAAARSVGKSAKMENPPGRARFPDRLGPTPGVQGRMGNDL